MTHSHFDRMKIALNAEQQSTHPAHKVGALLYVENQEKYISHPNFWPNRLKNTIGKMQKLGNASTTIHAEVATLLNADTPTQGQSLYITDLPCPNCAKMMTEAGLKNLYIDSHTHSTALGKKMKPFFKDVSLPIFESAGVNVFEINIETHTIAERSCSPKDIIQDNNDIIEIPVPEDDLNDTTFQKHIQAQTLDIFAATYVQRPDGQHLFLCAPPSYTRGISEKMQSHIRSIQKKYEPRLQPINRILMRCARDGLKRHSDFLYTSRVPTSREFVNLIGAGYHSIRIGDLQTSRDEWGMTALQQIQDHDILKIKT